MKDAIKIKVLFVKLTKSYRNDLTEEGMYEITRGAWTIDKRVAVEEIKFVFATYANKVVEVYKVDRWTKAHYKPETKGLTTGTYQFDGEVDATLHNQYVGVDVSEYFANATAINGSDYPAIVVELK